MKKFDLLVIGSGPAASRVADKCAEEGWNVAIAEAREFGGTCALRGCNPKKVFVHAAEVVDAARRSHGKLCDAGEIGIDWSDLLDFKRSFTEDIPRDSRADFEEKGITTFSESPRFISPTELTIDGERVKPERILIATGAKPRPLDFEGAERVTLSDGFMDLESLPNEIVYAAGDCAATDAAPLTPAANAEAYAVANNLLGDDREEVSYGPVPAVVFTIPALASVGLTEQEARDQDQSYRVEEGDMSDWGSVKKVCESTAAYKILIDEQSDQILGAHLIGPAAAESINLFAVAMKFEVPARELKSVLMASRWDGPATARIQSGSDGWVGSAEKLAKPAESTL